MFIFLNDVTGFVEPYTLHYIATIFITDIWKYIKHVMSISLLGYRICQK